MQRAGLPVPGEAVTSHLRGGKDKGCDEGGNPAVAEIEDGEPGDALHDDDVGQEEEEEQVVGLEQVHALGGLLEVPEVLGDLGLSARSTEKGTGCRPVPGDRCLEHGTPFRRCGKSGQSTTLDPMGAGPPQAATCLLCVWHGPRDCVLPPLVR